MSARRFRLPGIALVAVVAMGVAGCSSSDGPSKSAAPANAPAGDPAQKDGQGADPAAAGVGAADSGGEELFFAAGLRGANEVPGNDGKAVGDPDGRAIALVKVKGNQVTFGLRWEGIAAPTAAHVHAGAKGANGAVKVPFFGAALPASAQATTGAVQVEDAAVAQQLRTDPAGLYVNLHNAEFPGGAVRGQLVRLNKAVDVNSVLKSGTLAADADARQEVQNAEGKKTGDPDGKAVTSVRPWGDCIEYAFSWTGVAPPTLGHLHKAPAGANGEVVAMFFDAGAGLPPTLTGIAGTVEGVDRAVVDRINANPANYYTNLHTGEFPGGAVRGQLSKPTVPKPPALNLPVVTGAQIYQCAQKDGTFSFQQLDVSAKLEGDIDHTFVAKSAGPPQWVAKDGSSVTGKLATRLPNGDANIPELVLDATQTGKQQGLFSATTTILRLNTQGGVAPAGTCDPATQPTVQVPYKADYLFLG